MGLGLTVLQTYPADPGTVVFGAALPILFRTGAIICRFYARNHRDREGIADVPMAQAHLASKSQRS
jgi:hypothetical protein